MEMEQFAPGGTTKLVGVVHFGRNHCMRRDMKGLPFCACIGPAPNRKENGAALTDLSLSEGDGGPYPRPKASTHPEATTTRILRLVGSKDSNQQQGWDAVEGCGAMIGSGMYRAGTSPVLNADWPPPDGPHKLFQGTELFGNRL